MPIWSRPARLTALILKSDLVLSAADARLTSGVLPRYPRPGEYIGRHRHFRCWPIQAGCHALSTVVMRRSPCTRYRSLAFPVRIEIDLDALVRIPPHGIIGIAIECEGQLIGFGRKDKRVFTATTGVCSNVPEQS